MLLSKKEQYSTNFWSLAAGLMGNIRVNFKIVLKCPDRERKYSVEEATSTDEYCSRPGLARSCLLANCPQ